MGRLTGFVGVVRMARFAGPQRYRKREAIIAYTSLGKQVLGPDGKHFADAHSFTAAAQITDALNATAGGGWQPIETAPRDGSAILVVEAAKPEHPYLWEKRYQAVHEASFEDGQWSDGCCSPLENKYFHVTHWMPLPPAPGAPA